MLISQTNCFFSGYLCTKCLNIWLTQALLNCRYLFALERFIFFIFFLTTCDSNCVKGSFGLIVVSPLEIDKEDFNMIQILQSIPADVKIRRDLKMCNILQPYLKIPI